MERGDSLYCDASAFNKFKMSEGELNTSTFLSYKNSKMSAPEYRKYQDNPSCFQACMAIADKGCDCDNHGIDCAIYGCANYGGGCANYGGGCAHHGGGCANDYFDCANHGRDCANHGHDCANHGNITDFVTPA